MMKIVAVAALSLACVLGGGSLSAFAQAPAGTVTVYTARKIVTMDPGWPEATAVAVMDGKILSVGTLADLKPYLDKYPHTIDRQFESRVLYPGFVEAHSHPIIGGTSLTRPPLSFFP